MTKEKKADKVIENRFLSENAAIVLLGIGILIIVIAVIVFLVKENVFITSQFVKADKVGQLGDFVGGVVGSLWALAGVILFYVALNKQKESLGLQRKELISTKEEFILNRITNLLYHQLERIEAQIESFEISQHHITGNTKYKGFVAITRLTTDIKYLKNSSDTIEKKEEYIKNLHDTTANNFSAFLVLFLKSTDIILAFDEQLKLSHLGDDIKAQLKKLMFGNLGSDIMLFYEFPVILDEFRKKKYNNSGLLIEAVLGRRTHELIKYSKKISSVVNAK